MSETPPSQHPTLSPPNQVLSIEKIDAHRIGMISLAIHTATGLLFLPFALIAPLFVQFLIHSAPGINEVLPPEISNTINASTWIVSLLSFFISISIAATLGYAFGYSLAWFYNVLAKWKPNTFTLKITTSKNTTHA